MEFIVKNRNETKFKIGDTVRLKNTQDSLTLEMAKGHTAKIIGKEIENLYNTLYNTEWDEPFCDSFHDCCGKTKARRGYNIREQNLELIKKGGKKMELTKIQKEQLDKDTQILVQRGVLDTNLTITNYGKKALEEALLTKEMRKTLADAEKEKEKEEKKAL